MFGCQRLAPLQLRLVNSPCRVDEERASGQLVWLVSLRHSLGPPGEVPLSMTRTRYALIGSSRIHGRFGHREAVIRLAAPAAAVKTHPSGERGPSPHPNRRGPNHAFFPIRGEVRMLRSYHRGRTRSRSLFLLHCRNDGPPRHCLES